jgi:integrase
MPGFIALFAMADIRKRTGSKGITYQVRYPNAASETGYAYETFATLKEARDFRENSAARLRSRPLSSEIRTVEQGLRKWLDVCEKEGCNGREPITKGTLQNYEYRVAIINGYNWTKQLHELTAPDVVEFRSWLLRNHSRAVAHKALTTFHSMVLELMRRGIVAHDFAAGIAIPSTSRYDRPITIPTEKEVHSLLAAADALANIKNETIASAWRRYRPMLYLAADSGMRPQEYIAAARANLKDGGIKVDRALERLGEISVTKTPAGHRFIDLSPETVDMIEYYVERHAPASKYDLLFPAENGRWVDPKNWTRRGFYVACEKAGLLEEYEEDGETVYRPKFSPYDLRHFFASMLIEQRVNLKRIQYLMGHEDIRTTLNVYGHLIERVEAKKEKPIGLLAAMAAE